MTETGALVAKRMSDMMADPVLSALVYGQKGCGKTWFAGTAGDRNLFITVGNSISGLKTLKSPLFKEKVGADPFVVELHEELNAQRMPIKATLLDQVCKTIDDWLEKRHDDFDTVTIDDATNTRRAAMFKGFEINQMSGLSEGWVKTNQYDVPMPGIQDYGQEMKIMQWFVDTYLEILAEQGKNFLFLAHERYTFKKQLNSKGNPVVGAADIIDKIRPAFVGKTLPDDITVNFDEVWHIEKKGLAQDQVPILDCYGDNQILASTRHAGIFNSMEPRPNFLDFLERIKKAS
jgi:hypothetical protein